MFKDKNKRKNHLRIFCKYCWNLSLQRLEKARALPLSIELLTGHQVMVVDKEPKDYAFPVVNGLNEWNYGVSKSKSSNFR